MKNKKLKFFFFLIFIIFSAILIKIPNEVYAEDYIILGDSRTIGIYDSYFRVYNDAPLDTVKTVNGNKVTFLAAVGARYKDWFQNSSHYAQITRALNSAQNGTKCLYWLGINDISQGTVSAQEHVDAVAKLAKQYSKINFSFCGVSGVYEAAFFKATNTQIKTFNQSAKSAITRKSLSNFKYKEIGNAIVEIESQRKTVNGFINTRYFICNRWITLF